jgi:hypothetical protein
MKTAFLLAFVLVLTACGSEPQPTPGPLVSSVTPSAATLAKLAAADRLDGTEDEVIELCPACGLRMAGKSEFACRIGAYTTHSCTARCSRAVCEDPDAVFAEIEVPEK